MASILKIDVLEQRYANSGIYLSGRIHGPQGDIINNGRVILPGNFEANTFNVLESLDANTINANTIFLGGVNGKLEFDANTSTLKINNASLALQSDLTATIDGLSEFNANTITANSVNTFVIYLNDGVINYDSANTLLEVNGNTIAYLSDVTSLVLNDLVDVNSTATANQVLTAFGNGSFYFANAATSLSELTDIDFTTVPNGSFLSTDGAGNYYFANAAASLSELTDVNATANANQVLTADGTGGFYFADAATSLVELTDVDTTVNSPTTINGLVLTSDGDGTYSFQTNIGDNQKVYVAAEDLTAGDLVALTSDGKVENIQERIGGSVVSTSTLSNASDFYSGKLYDGEIAYDSSSNKIIVAAKDYSTNKANSFIGEISNNNIVFGNPSTFTTNDISYISVTPIPGNKIAILYSDNDDTYNRSSVIIGQIDSANNTVNFPSAPTQVLSGQIDSPQLFNSLSYNATDGVLYAALRASQTRGYIRTMTISGTSVNLHYDEGFYGNPSESVQWIDSIWIPKYNYTVLAYRNGNGNGWVKILWRWPSSPNYFSRSTHYVFSTSANVMYTSITYDEHHDRIVIVYRDGSNANRGTVVVGRITGTTSSFDGTVTFGTPVVFDTSDCSYTKVVYDSLNKKVVISYETSDGQGKTAIGIVSPNDNSISIQNDLAFENNGTQYSTLIGSAFDSNSNTVLLAYNSSANANNASLSTYTTEVTSGATNALDFLGIAQETILANENVIVNLEGSLDSNQTGLTKDESYYVTSTGELTTSQTDYGLVGKALSATDFQIFAKTSLTKLVDVNSTASNNQVLTADGTGGFFFANNAAAEISTLTDIGIADGEADQVLTTDGNGSFFFGHTLSILNQDLIDGGEITQLRDCRTVIDLGNVDTRLGYAAPEGSKTVLLANDSTIVSSTSASILSESNGVVKLENVRFGNTVNFTDIANDSISGDKIDGGTISNFRSVGILDQGTEIAIQINSNDTVSFLKDVYFQGNNTIINTQTVEIEDKNIVLGKNAVDINSVDGAGITIFVGNNNPVITEPSISYKTSEDAWVINKKLDVYDSEKTTYSRFGNGLYNGTDTGHGIAIGVKQDTVTQSNNIGILQVIGNAHQVITNSAFVIVNRESSGGNQVVKHSFKYDGSYVATGAITAESLINYNLTMDGPFKLKGQYGTGDRRGTTKRAFQFYNPFNWDNIFTSTATQVQGSAYVVAHTHYGTPAGICGRKEWIVRGNKTISLVQSLGDSTNGYANLDIQWSGNILQIRANQNYVGIVGEITLFHNSNSTSYDWNEQWHI